MHTEEDIKTVILADIEKCRHELSDYGHDPEKMALLFNEILCKYIDKIHNFAEDLAVVSSYDDMHEKASTHRINVAILCLKLEDFRDNGFTNENLRDFSMRNDFIFSEEAFSMDISRVRVEIGLMDTLSHFEQREILEKLDEMDEIFSMPISKRKRWDHLRPYIMWLSGKEMKVAMKLLPLFLKLR